MRIDMHCHIAGNGSDIDNVDDDVYFEPGDNHHWFARFLYGMVEKDLEKLGADRNEDGKVSTKEYVKLLYRLLKRSKEIDAQVLLGLDAVFSNRTGKLKKIKTDLWVSNRYLAKTVDALNARFAGERKPERRKKRFYMGASVSPNREDWEEELDWVITQSDAVLLKMIPSVQHVRMMDSRHCEFFDTVAAAKLPLLCHVGPEYSFPEGIRKGELDDFRKLDLALERGVTVIVAHCATSVFPIYDKNEVREFSRYMKAANADGTVRLYADTSALSLSTRIPLIPQVLEYFPPEWLLHGSDFPIPIDGSAHLPIVAHDVSPREYLEIRRTENVLDRDVAIKRAMGFSDSILTNAEKVLRPIE
jgi:predicted TIM-barrel fold metal-dependent hydrolase